MIVLEILGRRVSQADIVSSVEEIFGMEKFSELEGSVAMLAKLERLRPYVGYQFVLIGMASYVGNVACPSTVSRPHIIPCRQHRPCFRGRKEKKLSANVDLTKSPDASIFRRHLVLEPSWAISEAVTITHEAKTLMWR